MAVAGGSFLAMLCLEDAGKEPKLVTTAVMRKLIVYLNALIKNNFYSKADV